MIFFLSSPFFKSISSINRGSAAFLSSLHLKHISIMCLTQTNFITIKNRFTYEYKYASKNRYGGNELIKHLVCNNNISFKDSNSPQRISRSSLHLHYYIIGFPINITQVQTDNFIYVSNNNKTNIVELARQELSVRRHWERWLRKDYSLSSHSPV